MAMTRVIAEKVSSCPFHKEAGKRDPGIKTNARLDFASPAWR